MKTTITLLFLALYAFTTQAQSSGDFRTRKTGNWNDTSVWQKYSSGKWVAARAYPTYTDGAVSIEDTTVITFNITITVDEVTVQPGAELDLYSGYTMTLNGTKNAFVNNGVFNMTSGAVNGTGKMVNNGEFLWAGGSIASSLINEGKIALRTNTVYLYAPSIFTNNGIVNWYWSGTFRLYNGAVINNNNVFNIYSSGLMDQSSGGTFNNDSDGVVNIEPSSSYVQINVTFNNKGTMNFNGGTFGSTFSFTNRKTMNFNGGVFQNQSNSSFAKGTSITGTSGSINISNYTLSIDAPSVDIPQGVSTYIYNGSTVGGTGTLNINGKFYADNSNIACPMVIKSTGVMDVGATYYNYFKNTLTNNGTINWMDYDFRLYNGSVVNNGNFNIYCDNILGIYSGSGSFSNGPKGVITKNSLGYTTFTAPTTNNGIIQGSGQYTFSTYLTNNGIFQPGIADSTSLLYYSGNYINKSLHIVMKGGRPGLDYDRLHVYGNINLGSDTLTITANDTVPNGTYIILSCSGVLTGMFKVKHLPTGYKLAYKSNRVVLTVSSTDFTSDENSNVQAENATAAKAVSRDKKLAIYPVPATNVLNIRFKSSNTTAHISILNSNKQTIKTYTLAMSDDMQVDISSLAAGTYFVTVNDGTQTETAKLVKE